LSKNYNNIVYFLLAVASCVSLRFDLLNAFIYPILLTFAIIYFAVYFPFKIKSPAKFGDLSYGVYIYHFPIYQILIQLDLVNKIGYYKTIFMGYFLTLICAYLSWHVIEKRFLKK
jgi:peptidoglycan/LPS O-acetylase OafA/YrhL